MRYNVKIVYGIVLVAYLLLVLWLTICSRKVFLQAVVEWMPFWTYSAILSEGKEYLVADIVNNVLLFLPIGVLMGLMVTQKSQKWWRGWLVVVTTGIILSVGIEGLQFVLKRGLCETDDVIHNTVGCLMGMAFIKLLTLTTNK